MKKIILCGTIVILVSIGSFFTSFRSNAAQHQVTNMSELRNAEQAIEEVLNASENPRTSTGLNLRVIMYGDKTYGTDNDFNSAYNRVKNVLPRNFLPEQSDKLVTYLDAFITLSKITNSGLSEVPTIEYTAWIKDTLHIDFDLANLLHQVPARTLYTYCKSIFPDTDIPLKFGYTEKLDSDLLDFRAFTIMVDAFMNRDVYDNPVEEIEEAETPLAMTPGDIGYYAKYASIENIDLDLSQSCFEHIWKHCLTQQKYSLVFQIPHEPVTKNQLNNINLRIRDARDQAMLDVIEYSSFITSYAHYANQYTNPDTGKHYLIFSFKLQNKGSKEEQDTITKQIKQFETWGDAILQELHSKGKLNTNQSDIQKLETLFLYCTDRLSYDMSFKNSNGYLSLKNNTATCQGYTALFSYLAHKMNIPISSETGYVKTNGKTTYHIWNAYTMIDPKTNEPRTYKLDSTFADPIDPRTKGVFDRNYFMA